MSDIPSTVKCSVTIVFAGHSINFLLLFSFYDFMVKFGNIGFDFNKFGKLPLKLGEFMVFKIVYYHRLSAVMFVNLSKIPYKTTQN